MPTLYSAQVPAGYGTQSTGKMSNSWEGRATSDTKSSKYLPYIVSGPLSDGMWIVGTIGAIVHILFWIFSIVCDGLLVSRGDAAADHGLQFAIFSLIFTLIGFVTLLVITIIHWATDGIKDGGIPPFLITILTGSVKVTLGWWLQPDRSDNGAYKFRYIRYWDHLQNNRYISPSHHLVWRRNKEI